MDEVEGLPSRLIGELLALSKRISERGGMLRLCGLQDPCQQALKLSHLHGHLSSYGNRIDALLGNAQLHWPR
jgi:anti-anti-sigma regulatory factor